MITFLIIGLTVAVSLLAFNNNTLSSNLIFYPPAVAQGQWSRLFGYGLLHADYIHLFFNMFTFYLFGSHVEQVFKLSLGVQAGAVCFALLYLLALPISILPTYFKNKHNSYYHGVGASGAVSAVVFAYVLINPMNFMGIMFIPIMMPAFLFAAIFIVASVYLDRNHSGGINHSAHITGGIFGVIYMIAAFALMANTNLLARFFDQIRISSINDIIRIGF